MPKTNAAPAARYPQLLNQLEAADREWLLSRCSKREIPRYGLVFSQNEPINEVFVIHSGRVKAYYTTSEGQTITFAYWLEGMLMGVPGVSLDFKHMWTAEAVTPTTLLRFTRGDLNTVIDRSISAAKAVIEILEFKTKYLSRLTQLLATAPVLERLRVVLANLCELYGVPVDDGMRIDLPLTHADIGDMVGASRQWVTISFGRLERAGIVRVRNRQITVLARENLADTLGKVLGASKT